MGYLCLTRRKGDSFFIGKDHEIEVKIADDDNRIEDNQIKILIKAPKSIPILRKELIDKDKEKDIDNYVTENFNR